MVALPPWKTIALVSLLASFGAQAAGAPVDPHFREALYYAMGLPDIR